MNGSNLKGRNIAVDWSLPKGLYDKIADEELQAKGPRDEMITQGSIDVEEEEEEGEGEDIENDDDSGYPLPMDEDSDSDNDSIIITTENDVADLEESPSSMHQDRESNMVNTAGRLPSAEDGTTVFVRNLPLDVTVQEVTEKYVILLKLA